MATQINKYNAENVKSPAMSKQEKDILLDLVKKFEKIIENKKTNQLFASQKDAAWEKITKEFNSNIGVSKRSTKTLRKSWDNLKTRAKKEFGKERIELFKTGGGANNTPKPSVESEQVRDIIGKQIDPLNNPYDDDEVIVEDDQPDFVGLDSDNSSNDGLFLEPKADSISVQVPQSTTKHKGKAKTITPTAGLGEASKNKKFKPSREDELLEMEGMEHDLRIKSLTLKIEFQQKIFEQKMKVMKAKELFWEQKLNQLYSE